MFNGSENWSRYNLSVVFEKCSDNGRHRKRSSKIPNVGPRFLVTLFVVNIDAFSHGTVSQKQLTKQ